MRVSTDRSVRRDRRLTSAAAPGRVCRKARPGPPGRWSLLVDDAGDGPWNMAVDMALARVAEPDLGVLRVYRWARPTISFGRNQRISHRYDIRALHGDGLGVVRRPTGGREVVHDRELTYSCVLPARSFGVREAYRSINSALASALRSLGVPAQVSPGGGEALSPDAGPCFGRAVANEIEVAGRKIAGSAQVRVGRSILQHGSILLAPPRRTPRGFEPGGISTEEVLGRALPFDRVAEAVEASMRASFGGIWERGGLDSGTLCVARELEREYGSRDWTWRR